MRFSTSDGERSSSWPADSKRSTNARSQHPKKEGEPHHAVDPRPTVKEKLVADLGVDSDTIDRSQPSTPA